MAEMPTFNLNLSHVKDFQFKVEFDWDQVPAILMDEPEPLGQRKGPNAARLLGAAVGNCLSASLLFCLQKAKVPVNDMKTHVTGTLVRNEKGRLRVGKIDVEIRLDLDRSLQSRISRCLAIFEDYCVVTANVRKGIEVNITVKDQDGNVLEPSGDQPVAS
ncbi:MAG: OsmC family peroxiredoxin [Calditrichaeota bacterium]|nr:MAG: OsmC family peroxiredoxin [Calditrichota bacterium]